MELPHTDLIRNLNKDDFYSLSSNKAKIEFLLRFAILAPSTHNSQPWLFAIGLNSCKIYYDPSVNIRYGDMEQRDLYITIGCLLENFAIVSRYFNIFDRIDYILEGNFVGELFFRNLEKANFLQANKDFQYLLETILRRVNVRGKFLPKQIPKNLVDRLQVIIKNADFRVDFVQGKSIITSLAEIQRAGMILAHKNPLFRREMSKWIHSNFSRALDGLPGYSLKMTAILSLVIPKLIRYVNLGKFLGKMNYEGFVSAPMACIISSRDNTKSRWLNVGQLAERLMLELQYHGVSTSIFVASLEINNLFKDVQRVMGFSERPHFLFVAGYMKERQNFTPRLDLNSKII